MNEVEEKTKLFNKTTLGFWLYLMTDVMLFASLFATFAVLRGATADGPTGKELFELPTALAETLILLTSSYMCGMGLLAMKRKNVKQMLISFTFTAILGVAFLSIELREFIMFVQAGHSWQQSAFLSSFFTLVGTHGLHILTGLIWLVVMMFVLVRRGLSEKLMRQIMLFGMFWHFLDLVWIFIFTVVYLMGVSS